MQQLPDGDHDTFGILKNPLRAKLGQSESRTGKRVNRFNRIEEGEMKNELDPAHDPKAIR